MTPPEAPKKAASIPELLQVCKPRPLKKSELDAFFVESDWGRDPHQKTREVLEANLATTPGRVLFYGHGGCGKSTELVRFLAEREKQFLSVTFSVAAEMTPSNVRAEDLVLVIAERVLQAAQANGIPADEKSLEKVHDYFAKKTKRKGKGRAAKAGAGAGVKASGAYLAKLLGLFVDFSGEIQMNSYSEETSVFELRKRPDELLDQVNLICHAVRKGMVDKGDKRRLLVVVEELDKLGLSQARRMYVDDVHLLTKLTVDIIYTIPIFLFHSPDANAFVPRFDGVVGLPMIKTWDPDTAERPPGFDVVRKIVLQRVDKVLIEENALDLLIEKTGGVLRHAFKVLEIVATMANIKAPISTDDIRYGLKRLRKECWQQIALPFEPLREDGPKSVNELYDRLTEYAKVQRAGNFPVPSSDTANQILLQSCALVEYNGEGWFGVHPLVMENLEKLGRL